jgi:hypothetical protein
LCLALSVPHPKYLDELLTESDLLDWFEYYRLRPFGHWIDNEMRARSIAAWTGKYEMPSIVEEEEDLTEEEQKAALPGMADAEAFLEELKRGERNNSNDRPQVQEWAT